jgi:Domain of unknown function (DUF4184)
MPWTFAHPAAILPLRRLCPVPLDFSALVIGSMVPDLGYYLFYSNLARSAHSFSGSVLVCLPVGLIFWGIFHCYASRFVSCFRSPTAGLLPDLRRLRYRCVRAL